MNELGAQKKSPRKATRNTIRKRRTLVVNYAVEGGNVLERGVWPWVEIGSGAGGKPDDFEKNMCVKI